jgi:hypothetical protein
LNAVSGSRERMTPHRELGNIASMLFTAGPIIQGSGDLRRTRRAPGLRYGTYV